MRGIVAYSSQKATRRGGAIIGKGFRNKGEGVIL